MRKTKNFIKLFFIHLLLFLYKPFKKKPQKSNRYLFISTTGLGDTLWATPAIKAVKEKNPNSNVWVLTHSIGKDILNHSPYIDKIIVWKKPFIFHFFSLLSLCKFSFKKIFVFHASQRLVYILLGFLRSEKILGEKSINKNMDFLFTHLVDKKHVHEVYRRLAQVETQPKNPKLDFFLQSKEKREAKNALEKLGIDLTKPLILIHPGSKDRYRCYPVERLIKVATEIQKSFPAQFLITGGKDEKDLITPLLENIPQSFSFNTPLSIRQFASIMSLSHLVMTNDTGPMHLACSVQVHLIAFFSPSNPIIKGPISPFANIMYEKRSCSKCLVRKCLEPFCLYQIKVSAIVGRANEILKNLHESKNSHHLSQL